MERIFPDKEFWNDKLTKAIAFFRNSILPELMGRFYTRRASDPLASVEPSGVTKEPNGENGPWCTCQKEIEGSTLIGCDNEECKIQWFHMKCVNLQQIPQADWFFFMCQTG